MRSVPEWIGRTDDSAIPATVRLRIWLRQQGCCACCWMPIMTTDLEYDHIDALCNGGENRESNIRAVHVWCHRDKTKTDVKEKYRWLRKMRRHVLGKRLSKRPMPGSKASPWKRTFNHGWVRR